MGVTPFPVPFVAVHGHCAVHGRLGRRQRLHDMKNKLKNKETEKKSVDAHLAARYPVPDPVRRRSWPLGRARPFGTAWTPTIYER
jgi:hypothetical protein